MCSAECPHFGQHVTLVNLNTQVGWVGGGGWAEAGLESEPTRDPPKSQDLNGKRGKCVDFTREPTKPNGQWNWRTGRYVVRLEPEGRMVKVRAENVTKLGVPAASQQRRAAMSAAFVGMLAEEAEAALKEEAEEAATNAKQGGRE